ncbi:hypothetical protein LSG31_20710 [Fodinisporobacter ferrooxydans]|uniref:Uncharacterized protein n=1 Tax=Fodinisporobacter ferrooxydans TaxID=2901836 RepID=A0ABY4CIA4_9BACL|nr:hypothetical protein LSG31_20710 [Alicyclobacillaceae bacterium MYW30-H2]
MGFDLQTIAFILTIGLLGVSFYIIGKSAILQQTDTTRERNSINSST